MDVFAVCKGVGELGSVNQDGSRAAVMEESLKTTILVSPQETSSKKRFSVSQGLAKHRGQKVQDVHKSDSTSPDFFMNLKVIAQ